MLKLIKYEIRNSKSSVLKILLATGIASFVMQIMIFSNQLFFQEDSLIGGILPIIMTLLTISAFFIILGAMFAFYGAMASIIKNDIYQNEGYTTFSLPYNGYQIIGAKVTVAMIWSIILPTILIGVNFLLLIGQASLRNGLALQEIFKTLKDIFYLAIVKNINSDIFSVISLSILQNIASAFSMVLVIFSAVVLDYRIGKKKSNSAMWILYAFLIVVLNAFIKSTILPNDFVMGSYGRTSSYTLSTTTVIFSMIYDVALGLLLFRYVSNSFENKIEKY